MISDAKLVQLEIGQALRLGATVQGNGVNFAMFSAHATRVELCLFDSLGKQTACLPLPGRTDDVWHGFLPGGSVGQAYGFRVHGPDGPDAIARGHRFAPDKLLLDPYARALKGPFRWTDSHLGDEHLSADNAPDTYKAVVVEDNDFDWSGDSAPATPMAKSVLYEVHVKGFSQQHPAIDPLIRGTYAALASDVAITHFQQLGITALKLLPVHQAIDEMPLARAGKVNYWGYNTLAFFAPSERYARSNARDEFRAMVKKLHQAGIEVILDVVYNHTAEGDQRGPTLSMRGLDNASYYRLRKDNPRYYENHSGCGNTINISHPRVMQWVMDSLRYWVEHMHVDGFRFDLAAILGRGHAGFDPQAAFLHAVGQDPILSKVKLIAEPWDIGPGGYQLGAFPPPWSEWNDRYRNAVRAFWLNKESDRGELAARLAGSSECFAHNGRLPQASVNFICAHDGFTLHDLVSYDHKHNEANGEDNRDGTNDNLSWNCGHEGPSDLLGIVALRSRFKRAFVATLMLSRGVPMLLGGDEISRTQSGNNNAFQQDNPISWFDWENADRDLLEFVSGMVALRNRYPQLTANRWLTGIMPDAGDDAPNGDVRWLNRLGRTMHEQDWQDDDRFVLGMWLAGIGGSHDLLLAFNAEARDCPFALPRGSWRPVLDTALRNPFELTPESLVGNSVCLLKARSVTVFERH